MRNLIALISRRVLRSKTRHYHREPAPEFLFQRRHLGIAPEPPAPGQSYLRALNVPAHVSRRSEHFEFSTVELPALSLDLGPNLFISVTGAETDAYSLDLCTEIRSDDPGQAGAPLPQAQLRWDSGTLIVRTPQNLSPPNLSCYLNVITPATRPVMIAGNCAAVEVFGIAAPVNISTSHGVILLIDLSGDVNARTSEGSIVFTGKRGHSRLHAVGDDSTIYIKIAEQSYEGTLEVTADGPVSVLLPPGSMTPLEVNIGSDAQFVCRADIQPELRRREEAGRAVVSYGLGEPLLKFAPLRGTVTMDTST